MPRYFSEFDVVELMEDALEGTLLDNFGNRDEDGLCFACRSGILPKEYKHNIEELMKALDELRK